MADVISTIGEGFEQSFLMAYEVWWALVLGFAISAIVQAWVPRERIESALGRRAARAGRQGDRARRRLVVVLLRGDRDRQVASSRRAPRRVTALAFQFASTNLVWELGLVLWILLGWQFTLAEFLGGIVMIALMALLLRLFVSPRLEERAREHAQHGRQPATSTTPPASGWAGASGSRRPRAWSDVAHNFRGDWQMLWKEITIGFLLAGFIGAARRRLLQRPVHRRTRRRPCRRSRT